MSFGVMANYSATFSASTARRPEKLAKIADTPCVFGVYLGTQDVYLQNMLCLGHLL